MDPRTLDEELSREPFVPLRLTLSTGEKVEITDPGAAFIQNLTLFLYRVRRRGSRVADDSRSIALRHIVQIERLQAA